tara:strand:- start:312 stop:779 length:468 start_codon:yes stop_codon:yes gene_type:complete
MGTMKQTQEMKREIGELGKVVHQLQTSVETLINQVELLTHKVNDPNYQFQQHEVDIGDLQLRTFGLNEWFLLDGQDTLNPGLGMTLDEAYEVGQAVAYRLKETIPFDCPEMIRELREKTTKKPEGYYEEAEAAYEAEQNAQAEGADAIDEGQPAA